MTRGCKGYNRIVIMLSFQGFCNGLVFEFVLFRILSVKKTLNAVNVNLFLKM